jgi:Asp-tRNA(Asn)/Glu-tRNA(Gln) amidotransferase C subunit
MLALQGMHARLMCHPSSQEVKGMTLSIATLKAMIHEYHGFHLSDEELERIRPELESYLAAVEQLRELDLANVLSARLLHVDEGGQS